MLEIPFFLLVFHISEVQFDGHPGNSTSDSIVKVPLASYCSIVVTSDGRRVVAASLPVQSFGRAVVL
jgi:hypothetical protein